MRLKDEAGSLYFRLSPECWALIEYRPYIDELMAEIQKVDQNVEIRKVPDWYCDGNLKGFARVDPKKGGGDLANMAVIEPINTLDRLYTFTHETGHIVHKHSGQRIPSVVTKEEYEANCYARSKFHSWGLEIPQGR